MCMKVLPNNVACDKIEIGNFDTDGESVVKIKYLKSNCTKNSREVYLC